MNLHKFLLAYLKISIIEICWHKLSNKISGYAEKYLCKFDFQIYLK